MEKDIGKIKKNDTTDIIIRVDDFGGVNGLTIREYVTSDRYTGFTKSGVRILGSEFKGFKEMINSIDEKDLESTPESSGDEGGNDQQKLSNEENSDDKEKLPDY